MSFVPKFARSGTNVQAETLNENLKMLERAFAGITVKTKEGAMRRGFQLGTSEFDAFPGDLGVIAYDHSKITGQNPHLTNHAQLAGLELAGFGITHGHVTDQSQNIIGEKYFYNPITVDSIRGRTGNLALTSVGNVVGMRILSDATVELAQDMTVWADGFIDLFSDGVRPRYIYSRSIKADFVHCSNVFSGSTVNAVTVSTGSLNVAGAVVDPTDIVHRSGDEEVLGLKTFSGNIVIGKSSNASNGFAELKSGTDATNGGKIGFVFKEVSDAVKGFVGFRSTTSDLPCVFGVNQPVMIGQKPFDPTPYANTVLKIGKRDDLRCGVWHGSRQPNTTVVDYSDYTFLIGAEELHLNAPGAGYVTVRINGQVRVRVDDDLITFSPSGSDMLTLDSGSFISSVVIDSYAGIRGKQLGDNYGRTILSATTGRISFGPGGTSGVDCSVERTGGGTKGYLKIDCEQLGVLGTNPVAKQTFSSLMVNQSTGTISTTIPDWGTGFVQATARNITRSIGDRIVKIEAALRAYGWI